MTFRRLAKQLRHSTWRVGADQRLLDMLAKGPRASTQRRRPVSDQRDPETGGRRMSQVFLTGWFRKLKRQRYGRLHLIIDAPYMPMSERERLASLTETYVDVLVGPRDELTNFLDREQSDLRQKDHLTDKHLSDEAIAVLRAMPDAAGDWRDCLPFGPAIYDELIERSLCNTRMTADDGSIRTTRQQRGDVLLATLDAQALSIADELEQIRQKVIECQSIEAVSDLEKLISQLRNQGGTE